MLGLGLKNYFAIKPLQLTYFTMFDIELTKCWCRNIKICKANKAVYGTGIK